MSGSVSAMDEATSASGVSSYSAYTSNPDLIRIFVQLSNGIRIVIPASQASTVQDVHVQTLRRAERAGIRGTLSNTVLQTTGSAPITLFGEDSLYDMLDLTEDNIFSLNFLPGNEDSANPSPADKLETAVPQSSVAQGSSASIGTDSAALFGSAPPKRESKVYIRWVTLEDAMGHSRLGKIPVDGSPFNKNTTLKDFYRIATERLCGSTPRGSCSNPRKLNLYLKECCLHAENNPLSLGDLGLEGSRKLPLDIFVEFLGPHDGIFLGQLSKTTEAESVWGFNSSKRGLCTFITSLKVLLQEIEQGHCDLDNFLEVLLELTHFPPLLLAFKHLRDLPMESSTPAGPVLLAASAFQEMCCKMAPPSTSHSREVALETSRQLMAWIYSLRSEASLTCGKSKPLVHQVIVRESRIDQPSALALQYCSEIGLPPDSNVTPGEIRKFLVSINEDNQPLCRLLGRALHTNHSSPWDFYFGAASSWDEVLSSKLTPTPHSNAFDDLLQAANTSGPFRMVGPMLLGACLAAELPIITLSAEGYVSIYEQEDFECGEMRFYTWNAVERKVIMKDANPGQFLSQKLDSIIQERKKLQTLEYQSRVWEVDAWAEWKNAADFGSPEEAIVICVDNSLSMSSAMPTGWIPSQTSRGLSPNRLTEVKEFFKNLALRISAYGLPTYLGLVTFSDRGSVTVQQPLTPLHLNFHQKLENSSAQGSTAIYDAVLEASVMLCELKQSHPQTKCRIIVLTDGEDNDSVSNAWDVSEALHNNDIVLDAIVIGTNSTGDLFKMAKNTGGYAFAPKTQQGLFQIFLLETVVDLRTRPDIIKTSRSTKWDIFTPKQPDMANTYDFPPCRPHPSLNDYFFALGDAGRFASHLSVHDSASIISESTGFSMATTMTRTTGSASGITRILLGEIKAAIENPHDYLDIYVSERNMGFWKVVMQGPPASPYANGNFVLFVEVGPEFPRKPPLARFITPVLHPNITKHGRICHPIFDREWTPATRVYQVLQQLYGILMSLEVTCLAECTWEKLTTSQARDVVDPLFALKFWTDADEGRREVAKYVARFASRSRAGHRADIIGDDVSTLSSNQQGPSVSSWVSNTAAATGLISNRSATPVNSPQPSVLPSSPASPSHRHSRLAGLFSTNPSRTPSYHTAASVASTTSTSTISGSPATARHPLRPRTGSGRTSAAGHSQQTGASVLPTAGSVGGDDSQSPPGSAGPASIESSVRRASRRLSFFAALGGVRGSTTEAQRYGA